MVSLEKNDHLMLARQLPLKSVALIRREDVVPA
ncbi:glucose-1-phosphate adenylyltransferase [Escherichia coli]|uniref:Glucose-1-phosphate adenylyltransferase n=1 Tax=Escherichia coli TaxID=562 RepID=A0A376VAL6_ECOLX|nr:glucose-1-phosphate adenylyltransferase [Escherichia coli]